MADETSGAPGANDSAPKQAEQGDRATELSPTALAREKAAKVVKPMIVQLAQNQMENQPPGTPLTEAQGALAFYADVLTMPPFKTPADEPIPIPGSPLMLPLNMGEGDTATTFNATITHIRSLDADPENGRMYFCIVQGPNGPMELPVPEDALADAQLATPEGEKILEFFTDDQKDEKVALETYRGLLEQRRSPDNPNPAGVPDDLLTSLGEKYPPSLVQPEKAEKEPDAVDDQEAEMVSSPLENARDRISLEMTKLAGKGDKLTTKERSLLADLGLAQAVQEGTVEAAFTIDALRKLRKDLKAPSGDDKAESEKLGRLIEDLKPEAKKSQDKLTAMLKEGNSTQQYEKWAKMAAEPGGMLKMLQDANFDKFLSQAKGSEVCTAIFGRDMTGQELKDMLKDVTLPKELQEAIDKGEKMSLIKILLMIAGGIIAAPIVVSIGAGAAVGNAVIGSGRQS